MIKFNVIKVLTDQTGLIDAFYLCIHNVRLEK